MKNFPKTSPSLVKTFKAYPLADDFYAHLIDWPHNIIYASGNKIYTTDLYDNTLLGTLNSQTNCLKTSPNKMDLCCGLANGNLCFLDLVTKKQVSYKLSNSRIGSVAWLNSNVLFCGSRDRHLRCLDLRTSNFSESIFHKQEVCGLSLNLDGRFLSTGGNDNYLGIMDIRNLKTPLHFVRAHNAAVKGIAWSRRRNSILVSGGGTADKCLKMWDINKHSLHSLKREMDEKEERIAAYKDKSGLSDSSLSFKDFLNPKFRQKNQFSTFMNGKKLRKNDLNLSTSPNISKSTTMYFNSKLRTQRSSIFPVHDFNQNTKNFNSDGAFGNSAFHNYGSIEMNHINSYNPVIQNFTDNFVHSQNLFATNSCTSYNKPLIHHHSEHKNAFNPTITVSNIGFVSKEVHKPCESNQRFFDHQSRQLFSSTNSKMISCSQLFNLCTNGNDLSHKLQHDFDSISSSNYIHSLYKKYTTETNPISNSFCVQKIYTHSKASKSTNFSKNSNLLDFIEARNNVVPSGSLKNLDRFTYRKVNRPETKIPTILELANNQKSITPMIHKTHVGAQICNLYWTESDNIISTQGYSNHDVRLYDNSLKLKDILYGHKGRVIHFAMEKNEKRFVTGGTDGKLYVWCVEESSNTNTFR